MAEDNSEICFVIDLRDNLGGETKSVAEALDFFLPPDKQILFIKEKAAMIDIDPRILKTKTPARFKEELIILVNENSASAAEIFADVIQRCKRGIVIGNPTLGKHCAQDIIKIQKGINLKLTIFTFEYITGVNKVLPDIIIKENEDALEVALEYLSKPEK